MPDRTHNPLPRPKGETIHPQWTFKWIDTGPLEGNEFLAPAKIMSVAGREFAALHLILNDLSFSRECFVEAAKIGPPDAATLTSKALLFSAVTAYARPFKTGAREIRLVPTMFTSIREFDVQLHDHLVSVRDKHVAHSVNEFEQCEATAVIVRNEEGNWRNGGAIGVIRIDSDGLSLEMVTKSISQVGSMMAYINSLIEERRLALHEDFKHDFANGKWEVASAFLIPRRDRAAKRRD